ncbi:hypothetical protein GCM10010415_10950 [Streptomyces atrovirens]|uniref:Uncharacterized protein n=1 Tax=Streptomyces atrovirens TaxID=285556 RepID=A0ABW0DPB1_9ACTN
MRRLVRRGAWERFGTGGPAGCVRRIADAVGVVTHADAIVLARASTTSAERLTTTPVFVLSSP